MCKQRERNRSRSSLRDAPLQYKCYEILCNCVGNYHLGGRSSLVSSCSSLRCVLGRTFSNCPAASHYPVAMFLSFTRRLFVHEMLCSKTTAKLFLAKKLPDSVDESKLVSGRAQGLGASLGMEDEFF